MKCAFTICTYSYTGLANVLKKSFLKYHSGYDFYMIYTDKTDNTNNTLLADSILEKYITPKKVKEMQFKYDVTEYSTSIKAYCCKYFIERGYEQVLYFDPDILFFSEFPEIENFEWDAYVTPHKLIMKTMEDVEEEANVLKHGLFNCGFIGFNKSDISMDFINWWCDRLQDYAFDDLQFGIYTDQKWIDYITIMMNGRVHILDDLGCNFAPWNIDERILKMENGKIYVTDSVSGNKSYPLVFMHFSGFNYEKLVEGKIEHKCRTYLNNPLTDHMLLEYGDELRNANASAYFKEKYVYNYYTNGDIVSKLNRRLYRYINKETIDNPFDTDGQFYLLMKKNRLIGKARLDVTEKNTANVKGKRKIVIFMFKMFKQLLGIDKYSELLRALQIYSFYDKQLFLINED